jgi:hypothetical protein
VLSSLLCTGAAKLILLYVNMQFAQPLSIQPQQLSHLCLQQLLLSEALHAAAVVIIAAAAPASKLQLLHPLTKTHSLGSTAWPDTLLLLLPDACHKAVCCSRSRCSC